LAKKSVVVSVIIGIILGSVGTFYSNYGLNYFGMEELILPSLNEEKPTEVEKQTFPKTLLTNELQYTLVEVKKTDFGINGEKPIEGGIFLITKIEIENFGKQEVIVYGKNWLLKDENQRVYTPKTFDATPEKNDEVFSIRIPPAFKITKNIGFEIPSNLESSRELFVADRSFESEPIMLGIV
jgi:hypothetical protein